VDDLVSFLKARLDEDETAIRSWAACCVHIDACDETGGYLERFDELRMLAEVEAKRRMLDLHEPEPSGYQYGRYVYPALGDLACSHCESLCHSSSGISCNGSPDAPWPCPTVRLIAAVYAEHPDYREEWRP
jgi:hypothetical protein